MEQSNYTSTRHHNTIHDMYSHNNATRHYRTGLPSWQRTLDYSSCWGPLPMVKHQKQTIMTRQVGGIHKGFAFEGFLKCLKWSEFAGSTSRKWSRKHSLGVYYNTIWLTTCGLHQFSKKYVCHSYDWLWTPPNTLNLKAFRAVSCIFWWLPSQLSKVKLEAKVLQDPSRPILQALSK